MGNNGIAFNPTSSVFDAGTAKTQSIGTAAGAPKPEKIVIETSKVDIDSREYQLVLGAVRNHAQVVCNSNVALVNCAIRSNDLKSYVAFLQNLDEAKEGLKLLQSMKQTKDVLDGIKILEQSIADSERDKPLEKQKIVQQELDNYQKAYNRYIKWQANTLDIYENEVFPNDKMVANYLVALRNFHDKITLFSIFDKKTGNKAGFALCRVPVSTMQKFFNDPAWNKPAYVIYPIDAGYKDLGIDVTDMAKYRETKDQLINAIAKAPLQYIQGNLALIDDREPKMFASAVNVDNQGVELAESSDAKTMVDRQSSAKVLAVR